MIEDIRENIYVHLLPKTAALDRHTNPENERQSALVQAPYPDVHL